MKNEFTRNVKAFLLAALLYCMPVQVVFSVDIDADDKYAWAENAGWLNFNPTYGGVSVVWGSYGAVGQPRSCGANRPDDKLCCRG